jgi:hypothetical protein
MKEMRDDIDNALVGGEGGRRAVILFCEDKPSLLDTDKQDIFDDIKDNIQIVSQWKHVVHIPDSANADDIKIFNPSLRGYYNKGDPKDKNVCWSINF